MTIFVSVTFISPSTAIGEVSIKFTVAIAIRVIYNIFNFQVCTGQSPSLCQYVRVIIMDMFGFATFDMDLPFDNLQSLR